MDPKDFKGVSNEAARALLLERVQEALAEQAKPSVQGEPGESGRRGPLAAFLAGVQRVVRSLFVPLRRAHDD